MKNGSSKQFAWAQWPPVGKWISSSAQKETQHVCVCVLQNKGSEIAIADWLKAPNITDRKQYSSRWVI